jgi:hypothetical protein
VDTDWLNLEGDGAVLGEHGCHHIDDDVAIVSSDLFHEAYSLVLSVAVVSIKMFFVLPGTIFESAH